MITGPLLAGSARAPITGTARYGLGGPGRRRATGVHDDIFARCLTLSDGTVNVAIIGADVRGVPIDQAAQLAAEIRRRISAGPLHILLGATGVCTGPDLLDEGRGCSRAYRRYFLEQVATTAVTALEAMEPARLQVAWAEPVRAVAGYAPGAYDRMPVVTAVGEGRGPIATLAVLPRAADALPSHTAQVSADFLAGFHTAIEAARGGLSLALLGPVSPHLPATGTPESGQDSYSEVRTLGEDLATPVLHALVGAEDVQVRQIEVEVCHADVPVARTLKGRRLWLRSKMAGNGGLVHAPLTCVRLQDLQLVTLPAVVRRNAGALIRSQASTPHCAVIGCVNGMLGLVGPVDSAGKGVDGWPSFVRETAWPLLRDALPVV